MEVAVQSLRTMPLVAIVVSSVSDLRLQTPRSPMMLVPRRAKSRSRGVELIGTATVEQSCTGIFILRADLYVQVSPRCSLSRRAIAPARLQVDVRPAAVTVGKRFSLFLGRSRSIVAISSRIFRRSVDLHLAYRACESKLRMHECVHSGSELKRRICVKFWTPKISMKRTIVLRIRRT